MLVETDLFILLLLIIVGTWYVVISSFITVCQSTIWRSRFVYYIDLQVKFLLKKNILNFRGLNWGLLVFHRSTVAARELSIHHLLVEYCFKRCQMNINYRSVNVCKKYDCVPIRGGRYEIYSGNMVPSSSPEIKN